MAPNPIISQIYFFVTSHFGTLLCIIKSVNMRDSENTHQNESGSGGLCKLGLTSLHDFDGL